MTSRTDRLLSLSPHLLILAIALRYVIFYATASPDILIATPRDDAYYYFEIAKNIANTWTVTFDGIHATNGFHPAWVVVLTPVYWLTSGDIAAVRIIGVLTTILLASGSLVGITYVQKNHSALSTATVVVGLLYLMDNFAQMNMESSIVIPVGILSCFGLSRFRLDDLTEEPQLELFGVGLLLAVFIMARLDAVLFLAILGLFTAHTHKSRLLDRSTQKPFLLLFGPAFVTGLVYISANLRYFGAAAPVSAQAKSLQTTTLNPHLFDQFVKAIDVVSLPTVLATTVRTGGLIAAFAFIIIYITDFVDQNGTSAIAAIVSTFYLSQAVYYLFFSSAPMSGWYFYVPVLILIFVGPQFIDQLSLGVPGGLNSGVSLALLVVGMVFIGAVAPTTPSVAQTSDHFGPKSHKTATDLDAQLDGRLAMGDKAGAFGYFSDRSVIHLEGLVNDQDVLPYIENNSLAKYMNRKNVSYLIDSASPSREEINPVHAQFIAETIVHVEPSCVVFADYDYTVWDWKCIQDGVDS